MIMILNILLFAFICVFSYLLAELIINTKLNEKISKYINDKNEKYYNDLINYYNKNKKVKITSKLNLIYKINILIDKASLKRGLLINPVSIILLCILSFILCCFVVYSIFKVILLSIIIALPSIMLPIFILNLIAEKNNSKIEKGMLDFILQLKNYTRINNDIVYAFKQVKTIEPLQGYINTFLVEINSGIKFEKAIENIKEKINFDKLKMVFTNIEHCHLHGGDYKELMDKSYQMISRVQKEKNSRKQETKSARLVLGILILLDLIVYFSFIKNNYENYLIMSNRFFGNIILYWNFISIWLLLVLMNKVKKLDY